MEYFYDFLNSISAYSVEGAEPEDSSITRARVTKVVKQLCHGSGPGFDEIYPDLFKTLDIVGLCCLICLCNIVDIGGNASGVADWGGFPPFQEG